MITHSYIVSCLESYEIARQQFVWLSKILPHNWELIFVDDGSEPSIVIPCFDKPEHTTVIQTHDHRPWTQDIARNTAARVARGQYLLMTDIDHVFTPKAIQAAVEFTGMMCHFPRVCGKFVNGEPQPVQISANRVPPNIYLIQRRLFIALGGYEESLCNGLYHATDKVFLDKYEAGYGSIPVLEQAEIFVIPEEHGTFHGLERKRK